MNEYGRTDACSQAVRLPKAMLDRVGVADESFVEASVEDGAIVLRPIFTNVRIVRVPRLSDVFRDRTEEFETNEELDGPSVGDEML